MLITMVATVGIHRTLLQRFPGGWAFALAFQREVFVSLDVSFTAAIILPPSRRCRLNGALLDSRSCAGNEPASGTLRKALRYGSISEWRWRLRCAHHTGSLARLVRFGRGERRTRAS